MTRKIVKMKSNKEKWEMERRGEAMVKSTSVERERGMAKRVRGENPGGSQSINSLTSSPTKRRILLPLPLLLPPSHSYIPPALASAYPS